MLAAISTVPVLAGCSGVQHVSTSDLAATAAPDSHVWLVQQAPSQPLARSAAACTTTTAGDSLPAIAPSDIRTQLASASSTNQASVSFRKPVDYVQLPQRGGATADDLSVRFEGFADGTGFNSGIDVRKAKASGSTDVMATWRASMLSSLLSQRSSAQSDPNLGTRRSAQIASIDRIGQRVSSGELPVTTVTFDGTLDASSLNSIDALQTNIYAIALGVQAPDSPAPATGSNGGCS
jgi:hypothetical protein